MVKITQFLIFILLLASLSHALRLYQPTHFLDISPVISGITSLFTDDNSAQVSKTSSQNQFNNQNKKESQHSVIQSQESENNKAEESVIFQKEDKLPSRSSLEVVSLPISQPEIQNAPSIYNPIVATSEPVTKPLDSKPIDDEQKKAQEQKILKTMIRIRDQKLVKLLMQNTRRDKMSQKE